MIKGFILSAVLATTFLFSGTAFATVTCQPIYGGGETCVSRGDIDIEKKVKCPDTALKGNAADESKCSNAVKIGNEFFTDNLSISESKYQAGDQVVFRLTVTNTGDATLSSVEVKDILPQYVTFVSGPGNFDAGSKTLTYTLKDLKSKESRTDTVVVKVFDGTSLPINEGALCTVNQSFATSDGKTDQDNAQFCIEKKTQVTKGGLPVKPAPQIKETPPTGPEMWALIGLIPAGLSGLLLRRRSNFKK